MKSKARTTLALLVLLLILSALASERVLHALVHGPRRAEGTRVTPDDLRKLLLSRAEDAHAAGDAGRAWGSWREAYTVAKASGSWRAFIDVGDAAVGMGAPPQARQSYMAALAVARRERSVEGVLRAGEAFAGLGDHQVLRQTLRIAEHLSAGDPAQGARVHDFAAIFFVSDSASASPDTSADPCEGD